MMRGWLLLIAVLTAAALSSAQTGARYERTFRQSKSEVEKALKELQPSLSGRLPALDGFAAPGEHPLSRYQRGYYQTAVQVNSVPSGGTVVGVTARVTAWYADSNPSHSGYQLLTSNGRLESDLLEQLSDLLGSGESSRENSGARLCRRTPRQRRSRLRPWQRVLPGKRRRNPAFQRRCPGCPIQGARFRLHSDTVCQAGSWRIRRSRQQLRINRPANFRRRRRAWRRC